MFLVRTDLVPCDREADFDPAGVLRFGFRGQGGK